MPIAALAPTVLDAAYPGPVAMPPPVIGPALPPDAAGAPVTPPAAATDGSMPIAALAPTVLDAAYPGPVAMPPPVIGPALPPDAVEAPVAPSAPAVLPSQAEDAGPLQSILRTLARVLERNTAEMRKAARETPDASPDGGCAATRRRAGLRRWSRHPRRHTGRRRMTLDLDVTGIRIDGDYAEASWEHEVGGGDLRKDRQQIQAADPPTSKVNFEWDGWNPRTLTLTITLVPATRRGGGGSLTPEAALVLLHAAHRGGGAEPLEHRVTGRLARALAFDHPWVVDWLHPTETSEHTGIGVTMLMTELDPEAVSVGRGAGHAGRRRTGRPTAAGPGRPGARRHQVRSGALRNHELGPWVRGRRVIGSADG